MTTIIVDKLKQKISSKKLVGSFNRSFIFLAPMLDFNKDFINKNMDNLVNIYYNCEEDIDYDNKYKDRIYCVFKKDTFDHTKAVNMYNTTQFIGTIERDNYLIFIFKIPEIFSNDYTLFKKGMFSNMSKFYKAKAIAEYPLDKEYLRAILNPTDKDLQQLSLYLGIKEGIKEVYSVPETSDEIFKLSNFFKIVV